MVKDVQLTFYCFMLRDVVLGTVSLAFVGIILSRVECLALDAGLVVCALSTTCLFCERKK